MSRFNFGRLCRSTSPPLAALALAACATSAPPPTVQMTVARGAVEAAHIAGAENFAPTELHLAMDKLALAEKAMRDEKFTLALHHAEQSQADAQLAVNKTLSAKARKAAATARADEQMVQVEADGNARRVAPGVSP